MTDMLKVRVQPFYNKKVKIFYMYYIYICYNNFVVSVLRIFKKWILNSSFFNSLEPRFEAVFLSIFYQSSQSKSRNTDDIT